MNPRLMRALKSGGCVAPLTGDVWGVWRFTDLRMRPIGTIDKVQVGLLHMRGCLAQIGIDDDSRFVWRGPELDANDIPPSPRAAQQTRNKDNRLAGKPLLYRVVMAVSETKQQTRLLRAALDYAEDVERSSSSGQAIGMNWSALAAGMSVDAPSRAGRSGLQGYALDAARRLRRLSCCLGREYLAILNGLVVQNMTRHAMARRFSLSVPDVETKAAEVLSALADVYDDTVIRPERASWPPV